MKFYKYLCFGLLEICFAQMVFASETTIQFSQDLKLLDATTLKELNAVKAGDELKVDLSDHSIVLSKEGHVPVYLIGLNSAASSVKVQLKSVEEWPAQQQAQVVAKSLDAAMMKISQIRDLIAAGKNVEAFTASQELNTDFPNSKFVKLVHISALYVNGKQDEAKAELSSLYGQNQNEEEVLKLVRQISPEIISKGNR